MQSPPPDPLEDRIATHLRRLSVEIGPRPGGSPANHAAAMYIRDVYQSCGMDVEMREIACPAWEDVETRLEVNGGSLPAVANGFSQPCDVTAPAVALGTIAQLQAADLTGRIAILYGDLAENTLSPKAWFLISEKDAAIIRLLEEKSPQAVITVQPRLGELERIFMDAEFLIPSATVPARAGLALLRAESPLVHLRINSRSEPGRTWNVIGRKAGASRNRIVLCAHYDSNFGAPGALDNGGGVAVMLALAGLLSQSAHTLSLECIAFANEDSALPTGSLTYVSEDAANLGNIAAVMNFDGVGHALDVNTVSMMANSQPFYDLVAAVKQAYPGIIWVDPWPESDHSAFAMQGVACLAFMSRAERYLAHLQCDTIEWASLPKLAECARFAAQVVESVQDCSPAWTRAPAQ